MTRWRVGLAQFLVIVAVLAIGLAAMKLATERMSQASMALGLVVLMFGTLGAIIRRGGAWIGFTLFGWTYATIALTTPITDVLQTRLPVSDLITYLADLMHPKPPGVKEVLTSFGMQDYLSGNPRSDWIIAKTYCSEIGHVIAAFLFASLGTVAGHFLDDRSEAAEKTRDGRSPSITA